LADCALQDADYSKDTLHAEIKKGGRIQQPSAYFCQVEPQSQQTTVVWRQTFDE